eukprot:5901138-Pyramimonas_sp.AAC.1
MQTQARPRCSLGLPTAQRSTLCALWSPSAVESHADSAETSLLPGGCQRRNDRHFRALLGAPARSCAH